MILFLNGALMDREELQREYSNRHRLYERLAEEAAHIIENGLVQRQIKFHSVPKRVKEFSSFAEKAVRRQIEKPFEEITDLVGLRIVCLLRSDLAQIAELIRSSFSVVTEDDKLETQPVASFGYLSVHFVVRMKGDFRGPRYDGLHDIPFEIQVRTIAMDAWAAVSHYLDYKTDVDVPAALKKDFQALSGLFYLADTHF
jgi:putative GTP pyrophosphokinase